MLLLRSAATVAVYLLPSRFCDLYLSRLGKAVSLVPCSLRQKVPATRQKLVVRGVYTRSTGGGGEQGGPGYGQSVIHGQNEGHNCYQRVNWGKKIEVIGFKGNGRRSQPVMHKAVQGPDLDS